MKTANPFKKFNRWLDRQNQLLQVIILLSIVFIIRTFFFGLYWVPTGSMEPTMLVGESFFADKLTVWFKPIKRGEIISFNDPTFPYSQNSFINLFQRYIYGPDNWTKRVIGLPGDYIEGKIENGHPVIYINNKKLEQPFVNPYPIVQVKEKLHKLSLPSASNYMLIFAEEDNVRLRTFDPAFPITSNEQPFYHIPDSILHPQKPYPIVLYPYTPCYSHNISDIFKITLNDDEYFVLGDNRQGSYDSRGFGVLPGKLIHGRIICSLFSFDTCNSLIYELLTNFKTFITKKIRPWSRWFKVLS